MLCPHGCEICGFHYTEHKKSYYVDRHEDPDVLKQRTAYIKSDLADEIYEHCWIQLPRRKFLKLKYQNRSQWLTPAKNGKNEGVQLDQKIREFVDKKLTYEYKQDDGEEFVEIHVDYLYSCGLNDKDLPPLGKFGGNQSVRLPTDQKAYLFFGQDEAAYRSSSLNEKCWTIDGQF
jgi:hypothetical protein